MPQLPRLSAAALAVLAVSWTQDVGTAAGPGVRACTQIATVNQLQTIRNNLAGNYCLANDIDASSRPNFVPIGDTSNAFTGRFEGNGHVIRNLRIRSNQPAVGLFGVARIATIRNVTLENVTIVGMGATTAAGGLIGAASTQGEDTLDIADVHVSGSVRCQGPSCDAGGIVGALGGVTGTSLLRQSSSSADVVSSRWVGGIAGYIQGADIRRTYATGAVRCTGSPCMAGGLVARLAGTNISLSFATGPVEAADGNDSRAGGLVAYSEVAFGAMSGITASFAEGPVKGGASGFAAAFMAQHNGTGLLDQVYGVGPVSSSGATTGGLAVSVGGAPTITAAYWDIDTTGQPTSAAGTGLTTAQFRMALPSDFLPETWGITENLSYPFLLGPGINFAAPLATLVRTNKVFTFLPISQHDQAQYETPPADTELTSLAAVYTMIARAIGITQDVSVLDDVAIDRFFWNEDTQRVRWRGPVTDHASLGTLTPIDGNTPIEVANVIGAMDGEQLVILRGRYRAQGGGTAIHWLLGTLYRRNPDGTPAALLAHDPWTGLQVTINPATKGVVSPEDFPLVNFRVIGYQPVTLN